MFDENGNFIPSNSTLSQLMALQKRSFNPEGYSPILDPNSQESNLLSTDGGQTGGLFDWFKNLEEGQMKNLLGLGRLGLGAAGTIGGLVNSRNMLGLARDQFRHARDVTNTNLTNQIQSYNTALADRARTRAAMEGRDMESANRYIEENKLRR